jgi:RNA polymerase sigma-70 factor, ECF subfamily
MEEISKETVARASRGSVEAFETIYRAYSGLVYTIALRILNEREEAEEVTQDVFLAIHRKLPEFEHRSTLKTWVYRIAVNKTINYAKKRSRERDAAILYEQTSNSFSGIDSPPDRFDAAQKEKIIRKLLGALTHDQRACVVLREIEGLSYEEIAEVLNVNINTSDRD